jgi:hypothetical protein
MKRSMDRPRVRVDFNELVQGDLVLLSKTDEVEDSDGNQFLLKEGMEVFVYEFNAYDDDTNQYLFADGIAELNIPEVNGQWSAVAKWCCRINDNGITDKST